jgi:signal peptidase I
VRRWSADEEDSSDDEEDPTEEEEDSPRKSRWSPDRPPVFWRARDSLYFGPLVALAIVVVLIASLYAYTQNWPPVYVVESDSMQHGSNDVLGLINTGDLVLAEKIPTSSIQTYVDGLRSGYSTYGEYGDVLLYWPNGGGGTPVIHRAIVYLEYDPQVNGYNISSLAGLPCGSQPGAVYATPYTTNGCGVMGVSTSLELFHVGWTGENLTLQLTPTIIGAHSGYLTLGDNNFVCATPGACPALPDQGNGAWLSQLVEPGWVLGVARGMLPWFGALKLALEGKSSLVPSQSWQFLGLTVAGLIGLAFGIHFALRAEGIEDPRRRAQEEEEAEEEEESDTGPPIGESRGRRLLRSLRPWHRADDEEDEEEVPPRPVHRAPKKKLLSRIRRGRPRPHVRRGSPAKSRKHASDDPDDEL